MDRGTEKELTELRMLKGRNNGVKGGGHMASRQKQYELMGAACTKILS